MFQRGGDVVQFFELSDIISAEREDLQVLEAGQRLDTVDAVCGEAEVCAGCQVVQLVVHLFHRRHLANEGHLWFGQRVN